MRTFERSSLTVVAVQESVPDLNSEHVRWEVGWRSKIGVEAETGAGIQSEIGTEAQAEIEAQAEVEVAAAAGIEMT